MKSFQFSLRGLMAMTALIAVWAGLWTAAPSWQCGFIQIPLFVIVPTSVAVLAARRTGYSRTFYLAALAVMLMTAISQCGNLYALAHSLYVEPKQPYSSKIDMRGLLLSISQQKNATLFLWPVAFAAGAIAALTHRFLTPTETSRGESPTPDQSL